MSICTPNLSTKCIPICTAYLIIGTIPNLDTPVNVYIKDITTGRIETLQELSDDVGQVEIDISDYTFSDNHSYELWITTASGGINDKLYITIGESSSLTVALCFEDAPGAGWYGYSFSEETLTEA